MLDVDANDYVQLTTLAPPRLYGICESVLGVASNTFFVLLRFQKTLEWEDSFKANRAADRMCYRQEPELGGTSLAAHWSEKPCQSPSPTLTTRLDREGTLSWSQCSGHGKSNA